MLVHNGITSLEDLSEVEGPAELVSMTEWEGMGRGGAQLGVGGMTEWEEEELKLGFCGTKNV